MLNGKQAFHGEDVNVTLASVIQGEADLNLLPANIHPRVCELLTRCLQKEPKRRYSGISDVQYEIEQVLADPSGVFAQPSLITKPKKKLRVSIPWVAAITIIGIIIAGVAVWVLKPTEPKRVMRSVYELPEGQQFNRYVNGSVQYGISVSPYCRYNWLVAEAPRTEASHALYIRTAGGPAI